MQHVSDKHLLHKTRASLRHRGASSKLIIWCPFKPIFFELFWPRAGLVNVFKGACQNCG